MIKGLIGNIGRYSLKDGPGIRSTVFFKGCPLRCPWCHNPELISPNQEILFSSKRCINCGDCEKICPESAIKLQDKKRVDPKQCNACGICAQECPTKALELVGSYYSVSELSEILLRDFSYYDASNGGITLSGGEPTLQMKFAGLLLKSLKKKGVHTAIQTCGYFNWQDFEINMLPHVDLIFFDVKIKDPLNHSKVIGAKNDRIWHNLKRLTTQKKVSLNVRIPLIPEYTANKQNITLLSQELRNMGIERLSILPYHPYGISKFEKLGLEANRKLSLKQMQQGEVDRWLTYFEWAEVI